MFSFAYNRSNKRYEIESREFEMIKKQLLKSLTNMGQPIIEVQNANYENRGELLLVHTYEGVEIDKKYAEDTLRNLYVLWQRPVHLQSMLDDKPALMSYSGKDYKQTWITFN